MSCATDPSSSHVAVVTGGSSALGTQILRELITSANVTAAVCVDYDVDECKKTMGSFGDVINEYRTAGLNKMDITLGSFGGNISDPENAKRIVHEINEQYGPADILVNNVAVTSDHQLMLMPDNDWDDVINANLDSVFLFTKGFIEQMVKKKWGRIINIASVAALKGSYGQSNYAASMAALIAMSKSISKEVGKYNVTVNAVVPKQFSDTMSSVQIRNQKRYSNDSPGDDSELAEMREVSKIVAFLAANESSYVTGAVYTLEDSAV